MSFIGEKSDFLKLVEVEESKRDSLIDYSNDDFIGFREGIINYLKAVYPLDFQNFSESDLMLVLIEIIAYMGAVNSFKADYLANENFIRTAKNRNNVKDLLQLIGVRMKGPIGSVANAKLTQAEATSPYTIPAESRVINTTSPEDGGPLNFTVYKVVDGLIDTPNIDSSISIYGDESDNSASTVFTNLVLLEGSFVKEEGVFGNNQSTIPLTEAPVIERSIQIYVSGNGVTNGVYSEVDNIYSASGGNDRVFQVVYNDDFNVTILFGDNKVGQKPSPGDAYTITYRIGGGTRGNIASEVINAQILDSNGIVGTLENSSQATGGSDAETVDHAKRYAPLTFRRQDRLVTLEDFKTFANSFVTSYGGVGKATASVSKAFNSSNVVDLYVLEKASDTQLKRASTAFKVDLLKEIEKKKLLTCEVVIVDPLIRTIDISLKVRVDKELLGREQEIKLLVRNKALGFFNVDNNDFGKELSLAELSRDIFELPDVRFATVENIAKDIQVDFNEIIQLNNLDIVIEGV